MIAPVNEAEVALTRLLREEQADCSQPARSVDATMGANRLPFVTNLRLKVGSPVKSGASVGSTANQAKEVPKSTFPNIVRQVPLPLFLLPQKCLADGTSLCGQSCSAGSPPHEHVRFGSRLCKNSFQKLLVRR